MWSQWDRGGGVGRAGCQPQQRLAHSKSLSSEVVKTQLSKRDREREDDETKTKMDRNHMFQCFSMICVWWWYVVRDKYVLFSMSKDLANSFSPVGTGCGPCSKSSTLKLYAKNISIV